jgi:hypothetical protein
VRDVHKVCPTCEGEFEARLDACPDCGVALVWSTEPGFGESQAPRPGSSRLAPSPELVMVRFGDLGSVRALAARLDRAGIPSFTSIVPDPSLSAEQLSAGNLYHDGTFHLFVRPQDFTGAHEVDVAFLAEHAAEVEGFGGLPAVREDVCPACGAYLPEAAEECPSCELVLRWPDEALAKDEGQA